VSSHHQKFNVPNFNFTILEFPHSKDLEDKALEKFESTILNEKGKVAGVIVQPI